MTSISIQSFRIVSLILLLFVALHASAKQARHALLIGNAKYQHAPELINTLNDVEDVAKLLKKAGFEVTQVKDTDLDSMLDAVDKFITKVRQSDGVAMFYYSGHGIQFNGENYLIPIDARLKRSSRVRYEAFSVSDFINRMGNRGPEAINLVVLDACRDNPFSRSRSIGTKGLARLENFPESTLILYATKYGDTASDNPQGRNGLFTKHLKKELAKPGVHVDEAFNNVAQGVIRESGNKQHPWKEGVLFKKLKLFEKAKPKEKPLVAAKSQTVVKIAAMESNNQIDKVNDLQFWKWTQQTNTAKAYELYLQNYPQGSFAAIAQYKLEEFKNTREKLAKERIAQQKHQLAQQADKKPVNKVVSSRPPSSFETRGVIRQYISALNARNKDRLQALYADKLHYLGNDQQTKAEVIGMQQASWGTWNTQKIKISGKTALEFKQDYALATLTTKFVRTQEKINKGEKGQQDYALELKIINNEPKITSVKIIRETLESYELKKIEKSASVIASKPENPRQTIMEIQRLLQKANCNPGAVDGSWGGRSHQALRNFAKSAKIRLVSSKPNQSLLQQLRKYSGSRCTRQCGSRYELQKGNCILKKCKRGLILDKSGRCRKDNKEAIAKKSGNYNGTYKAYGRRTYKKPGSGICFSNISTDLHVNGRNLAPFSIAILRFRGSAKGNRIYATSPTLSGSGKWVASASLPGRVGQTSSGQAYALVNGVKTCIYRLTIKKLR